METQNFQAQWTSAQKHFKKIFTCNNLGSVSLSEYACRHKNGHNGVSLCMYGIGSHTCKSINFTENIELFFCTS